MNTFSVCWVKDQIWFSSIFRAPYLPSWRGICVGCIRVDRVQGKAQKVASTSTVRGLRTTHGTCKYGDI